ncbi:hypothetical protein AURDEDRAFT_156824 [Auricularia subglabra TFB-10046 SS5]|nr:hypothetical protein AURDEDRAFT_156824 [Auricularia subglabra TFB-10046 SS5]
MLPCKRALPALLAAVSASRLALAHAARPSVAQCLARPSVFPAFSTTCTPPSNMSDNLTPPNEPSSTGPKLLLPPSATPTEAELAQESSTTVLEVGGAKVLLDKLGPVVVNSDGTISRIANWHELSPHEQKTTLRRIGQRNQERRATLLQKVKEKARASASR